VAPQYRLSDAIFLAPDILAWNYCHAKLSPLNGATFE
jgi:hypothetical protein